VKELCVGSSPGLYRTSMLGLRPELDCDVQVVTLAAPCFHACSGDVFALAALWCDLPCVRGVWHLWGAIFLPEAADGSPAADEIRVVQDEIRGVERKIEDVEKETAEVVKKIDGIEAAIAGGSKYLGMTDPEALLKQLGRKEDEKEQLRRKEEQL
ncbi:unnamed protein product, partial [Scytosiphon promiscuus]